MANVKATAFQPIRYIADGLVADIQAAPARIRAALALRADYMRSVNELRSLTDRELNDIGIARSDVHRIAWEGVYGAKD